jgi:GNAT superfamily N-acetyltransferase
MTAVTSGQSPVLQFVEVSVDDPRSIELIGEVQEVYRRLYGSEDDSPMSSAEFESPSGTFLVAMDAKGHPIGCVGLRRHEEHVAEIKRMYVRPDYRRQGYARALLVAAEDGARRLGYTAIVLETGQVQPEAMALYEGHGYHPIPGFGHYRCAPGSRSFGRDL